MPTHTSHAKNARVVFLTIVLLLLFVVLTVRLANLQIRSYSYYHNLAEGQYTIDQKLTPARGEVKVVDKFSPEPYTVAGNIAKPLVYGIPAAIEDIEAVASKLAPIVQLEPASVVEKLSDKTKKYVPLKRQLSDEQQKQIQDLHLPGIAFDTETVRYYPEKNFLSQVLGFVGYKDAAQTRVGLYGLEKNFEDVLKGTPGNLSQEKDSTGAWIFGGKRDIQAAVDGDNLLLTIDKTLQFKAENILKNAVEHNQADSGSIIVMDPKTGAVIVMANYPDFDPNEYNKVIEPAIFNNLATTGNYEPGSVFKAFTMAAAINENKVSPDTTFVDTGQVVVDGYTIKNSDGKGHGTQTMTQVLEESLNTGAIFAKEQIGNETFLRYIKQFGFGTKTGIELPETQGNLDNLKTNIQVNFDNASFGQGLSVTPIQLVEAYGALANGGKMMKPHILQSRIAAGGRVITTQPEQVGQVVTSKTASTVSAMLVNVVENGHGKKAGVKGYYVAGKTGTAQVASKTGKGYEANNNIGSFVGYGPVEDPRFVMLVRVNHPRTVKFAETTAAPAFGEMAQFMLNYYDVAPNRK